MARYSRIPCFRMLASLALAVAVWLVIAWPLPRYMTRAIPVASHSNEHRAMVPGDHLQLLYHFWLVEDMIAGHTPWFHNLYEFNEGDDAARRHVSSYYMPFSLVYAAGSALGGRAFGWNLTGLISLWLTGWFTWLIVRRWAGSDVIGASGAMVALTFPYGWAMLMGGSPAGPSMMWPPVVALGVDIAIRERRARGGLIAGLGIFGAYATDTHVFFFSTLCVPAFAVLSLLLDDSDSWRQPRAWASSLLAMVPAAALLALSVMLNSLDVYSDAFHVRDFAEVALFSPHWRDFLIYNGHGTASQVYLDRAIPLMLLSGLVAFGLALRRPNRPAPASRSTDPAPMATSWRYALAFGIALLVMVGICVLALGPNGPGDSLGFRAARRLIPPYQMIRQPAKIFCLLPILFGFALALVFRAWAFPATLAGRLGIGLFCLWLVVQTRLHTIIGLCDLTPEQPAYAAVAADAAAAGQVPRVLVLPLWPGNSHYTSVYEYYVSLYRIRMLNGYHPFVPRAYLDGPYTKFEPLNAGVITDALLDDLLAMGIRHLLLHEDLFPEPASPFPVLQTIQRLIEHPRITLRHRADGVWAFAVHPTETLETAATLPDGDILGSARQWELEDGQRKKGQIMAAAEASGGAYLRLSDEGNEVDTPAIRIPRAPGAQWRVRARGQGQALVNVWAANRILNTTTLVINSAEWAWLDIPVPTTRELLEPLRLGWAHLDGTLDLDMLVLAGGGWGPPMPGDSRAYSPACFFHSGQVPPGTDHVHVSPDRDPKGIVFYGLKLPLETGPVVARLWITSPAAPGTQLGRLFACWADHQILADVEVLAGHEGQVAWSQTQNLPVNLVFVYTSDVPLTIERILLERPVNAPARAAGEEPAHAVPQHIASDG